jgi:HPt (histidine-containing phosphotransfer) domain-containing protein
MMHDEEFMQEVMREFLLDTPGQIADLRNRIASGDAREAGRRAHQIKGAAANVGGEAMRVLASAIEEAGKAGDLEPMLAAADELERQFVLLGNAMNEDGAPDPDPRGEALRACAPS